jgi:hypothetical protein
MSIQNLSLVEDSCSFETLVCTCKSVQNISMCILIFVRTQGLTFRYSRLTFSCFGSATSRQKEVAVTRLLPPEKERGLEAELCRLLKMTGYTLLKCFVF